MHSNHKKMSFREGRVYINPFFFIYPDQNYFVLWDYKNHTQFKLNKSYIDHLYHLTRSNLNLIPKKVVEEFLDFGIISYEPYNVSSWSWDILSQIFHIGTSNIFQKSESSDSFVRDYIFDCKTADQIDYQYIKFEGSKLFLTEVDLSLLEEKTFGSVLKDRMTSRSFEVNKMSYKEFSTLLFTSFGLFHGEWTQLTDLGLKPLSIRKTCASAGGLHPNEAFLVILSVETIKPGLYHYNVAENALTRLREGIFERDLLELLVQQPFAKNLSFGVFITCFFKKSWWKYKHSRAYRDCLIDVGHLSHNFQLISTALGLESWITGAFNDDEVKAFLSLEDTDASPLFFVGAGLGSRKFLPSSVAGVVNA